MEAIPEPSATEMPGPAPDSAGKDRMALLAGRSLDGEQPPPFGEPMEPAFSTSAPDSAAEAGQSTVLASEGTASSEESAFPVAETGEKEKGKKAIADSSTVAAAAVAAPVVPVKPLTLKIPSGLELDSGEREVYVDYEAGEQEEFEAVDTEPAAGNVPEQILWTALSLPDSENKATAAAEPAIEAPVPLAREHAGSQPERRPVDALSGIALRGRVIVEDDGGAQDRVLPHARAAEGKSAGETAFRLHLKQNPRAQPEAAGGAAEQSLAGSLRREGQMEMPRSPVTPPEQVPVASTEGHMGGERPAVLTAGSRVIPPKPEGIAQPDGQHPAEQPAEGSAHVESVPERRGQSREHDSAPQQDGDTSSTFDGQKEMASRPIPVRPADGGAVSTKPAEPAVSRGEEGLAARMETEPARINLPPQPVRQIRVSLDPAGAPNVEVLVNQRAGGIALSVHSPDQQVRDTLRSGLADLVENFDRRGLAAEIQTGSGSPRTESQGLLSDTLLPREERAGLAQLLSERSANDEGRERSHRQAEWELAGDGRKRRDQDPERWREYLEENVWRNQ